MGRDFACKMLVNRTTPVKNPMDTQKTTKVGTNKNVIDVEVDGSGDKVEGGAMLMAVQPLQLVQSDHGLCDTILKALNTASRLILKETLLSLKASYASHRLSFSKTWNSLLVNSLPLADDPKKQDLLFAESEKVIALL